MQENDQPEPVATIADTNSKPKRKAGRPKAEIDWDLVDEMLESGCFATHIADTLGIERDTLYNRCQTDKKQDFSSYSQQKRSNGESNIHKAQYETAVKHKNATMLIWLGKQRCGQKDSDDKKDFDAQTSLLLKAFLDQLTKAQEDASARKIEDKSNNNEQKS